ncbi:MAG: hypothetical protein ACJ8H8_35225 [Geminicoccaceae bacterium]
MAIWQLLEWVAWGGSVFLLLWMVLDALRVGRDFSEDVLLSSREGDIEVDMDQLERSEVR